MATIYITCFHFNIPCFLSEQCIYSQWRTQEFYLVGVQQIQQRTEDRENGDVGAVTS
jgi:hypothetical protein